MAWRDDVSESAQGDLDAVFSQAAMLAQTLLMRNREFFPFGATISAKGVIGLSTPVPDAAAPTVHDVIESIVAEVRKGKAGNRAYAIVALARAEDGGEAVRIELEHKEGVALVIGLPVVRGESGAVSFGDMRALSGNRLVWPAKSSGGARSRIAPSTVQAKASERATTTSVSSKASPSGKAPARRAAPKLAKPKSAPKPRGSAIATA